jgi:NhaA family Na+:H+ antiporter
MPDFLRTESGSAGLLLVATVVALVWANSPVSDAYVDLWDTHLDLGVADLDLRHWVNDGLMAFFFFLVGLEVKRELAVGELRDRRAATVPIVAALAGMALPALIYTAVNAGGAGAGGWGIVMATDIAFVLGVVALLGDGCPPGVRIFLLTLAVVDDIGAVAVIAVFYSSGVDVAALAGAVVVSALLFGAARRRAWSGPAWLAGAAVLWWLTLESGIHPAIAGVVVGLVCPVTAARPFERALHPYSSRLIVPLFALANAGVALGGDALSAAVSSAITLGVIAGLVVGKAAGVTLASLGAVRSGHGSLPEGMRAGHVGAAGTLAGIGFTVSLFVAELAFDDAALRDQAKVGVLAASLIAAVVGWSLFRVADRRSGA